MIVSTKGLTNKIQKFVVLINTQVANIENEELSVELFVQEWPMYRKCSVYLTAYKNVLDTKGKLIKCTTVRKQEP